MYTVALFAAAAVLSFSPVQAWSATGATQVIAGSTVGGDSWTFDASKPDGAAYDEISLTQYVGQAYSKYNYTNPIDAAQETHEKRSFPRSSNGKRSGSYDDVVALDSLYHASVILGSPPQTFNVLMDSGSPDFWVDSVLTPIANRTGSKMYDPSLSRTASIWSGYTFKICYQSPGCAYGVVFKELVQMGNLAIVNFPLGVAVSDTEGLGATTDGIFGLSPATYNSIGPVAQNTWFASVMPYLQSSVFTIDLKNGSTGNYEFGVIRPTSYTGAITYLPMTKNTDPWWTISTSGYAIGSNAFVTKAYASIVDSGTEVLILQKSIVDAYYAKVPGAAWDAAIGNYVYPCKYQSQVPSITIGVGAHRVTIPGSYLHWGEFTSGGQFWCYGAIWPTADTNYAILGQVFIKAQYVIFDFAGRRVGFADKTL